MSEVKRYDPGCDYAGQDEMVESVDGVYVKYSDYAALKAERDAECENWQKQCAALQKKLDAVLAKGMELCDEAAHVYEKYNVTQMPDMDLVDCQTIQEFSDLAGGSINTDAYANQLRAEGVEMFAKYCWSMEHTRADRRWVGAARNAELFAANLRKENGNG